MLLRRHAGASLAAPGLAPGCGTPTSLERTPAPQLLPGGPQAPSAEPRSAVSSLPGVRRGWWAGVMPGPPVPEPAPGRVPPVTDGQAAVSGKDGTPRDPRRRQGASQGPVFVPPWSRGGGSEQRPALFPGPSFIHRIGVMIKPPRLRRLGGKSGRRVAGSRRRPDPSLSRSLRMSVRPTEEGQGRWSPKYLQLEAQGCQGVKSL